MKFAAMLSLLSATAALVLAAPVAGGVSKRDGATEFDADLCPVKRGINGIGPKGCVNKARDVALVLS
ncbi:hypothetical protein B0T26DRAFT_754080 [Lasiosphaeria miniovina]|uniref:Uncharacterized protein n=1 Tax=Lasiosphaeria miniovina TaxID=1954250 RepID=A0AA40DUM5_9PEZI|nr:uncharacterized protein B0T26DRAFT_754080 [Lasiosphaeria miniovina]KAK0714037.1 hypothetical protein B0T26DRAFT_754080 [Lasiosphaeria miniovina]